MYLLPLLATAHAGVIEIAVVDPTTRAPVSAMSSTESPPTVIEVRRRPAIPRASSEELLARAVNHHTWEDPGVDVDRVATGERLMKAELTRLPRGRRVDVASLVPGWTAAGATDARALVLIDGVPQ